VILYLDTSDIVKLYVEEAGSDALHALVASAEGIATSRIAFAEVRCALARKRRDGDVAPADYGEVVTGFRDDWPRFIVVEATQHVVERAGGLCDTHALRTLDAIHLASALVLAGNVHTPVRFSSSDRRLHKAAASEGLA